MKQEVRSKIFTHFNHKIERHKLSQKSDTRPDQGFSIAEAMKRYVQGTLQGMNVARDGVYLDGSHDSIDMEAFSRADLVDQYSVSVEVRERADARKKAADEEKAKQLENEQFAKFKERQAQEEAKAKTQEGGSPVEPVVSTGTAKGDKLG